MFYEFYRRTLHILLIHSFLGRWGSTVAKYGEREPWGEDDRDLERERDWFDVPGDIDDFIFFDERSRESER